MNNLRLRLKLFGVDPLGTTQVIANVYPADAKARSGQPRGVRNLPVPAGDDDKLYSSVDLPDGRYLVELMLPSGRIVNREVTLVGGGSQKVSIEAGQSPHEWLALQHFQGNVGDRRRSKRGWVRRALRKGGSRSAPRPEPAGTADLDLPAGNLAGSADDVRVHWCVASPAAGAGLDTWNLVHDTIRSQAGPQPAVMNVGDQLSTAGPPVVVEPLLQDDDALTYQFFASGPRAFGAEYRPSGASFDGKRRYVLAHDGESASLMCAPVPWFDLHGAGTESAFEVLSPLRTAGTTALVTDPELGSLVGYLTSGALHSARVLVDLARDMLFHKISNPIGAMAGGYVMVATENERLPADWHGWLDHLCDWFPEIPDGAIIRAMHKLQHQQSDEDVDAALGGLLEAGRRGLPYYSLGMRWLLDGLTVFADDPSYAHRHQEIQPQLECVRMVARRTNYQQPFTSIELSRLRRRG